MADTHTIEIDAETAELLSRRAAERGVTVAELVAELAAISVSVADVSELERRWQAVESGADKTVPNEDVVRWLRDWGGPGHRPRLVR